VPTLGAVTVMPVSLDESMRGLQVASMEQRSPILAISLLLFAGVTSAWLGISGPIFPDVADKGLYKFLSDWQTLIGAMLQLCAAVLAAWIVWGQSHR